MAISPRSPSRTGVFAAGLAVALSAMPLAALACQAPPARQTVQIALERGPCFLPCATYKVSIDGDGNVVYEGKSSVSVIESG